MAQNRGLCCSNSNPVAKYPSDDLCTRFTEKRVDEMTSNTIEREGSMTQSTGSSEVAKATCGAATIECGGHPRT